MIRRFLAHRMSVGQALGRPNGFLPLAHHNRTITEKLRKIESIWAETFL